MKFGGTSVANLDRIKKIASIIKKETKKYRIVTVLSAMAGVTNNLQNYVDELTIVAQQGVTARAITSNGCW